MLAYRLCAIIAVVSLLMNTASECFSDELPKNSRRMTPLVQVIQGIEPGVVALFVQANGAFGAGSGTVIHPDGFVLTNNHVLPTHSGYALLKDGKPLQFRVVGRLPEKDIAIVELVGASKPVPVIKIGNGKDTLNGETVIVAGNPGGRGTVFTSGIVSSPSVLGGGQNALVMTQFSSTHYDKYIQFDAPSNPGNSGGPLINMDGELIGIVSAMIFKEQNIGFAIPVDRVWEKFDEVMESELLRGVASGITLKQQPGAATIATVAESVTAQHDIHPGDIVTAVNGHAVRHSIDWELLLLVEARPNRPLTIELQRGDASHTVELTTPPREAIANVGVEEPESGLEYKLYHGHFDLVPDFSKLDPVRTGVVESVDLDAMRKEREDEFAISASGYLKIPEDGIYRLIIKSDDGSRVLLHGKLVIDNDGNHPPKEASKRLALQAGFHPIRIEHFERNGEQSLQLFIEMVNGGRREVGSDMLFHK